MNIKTILLASLVILCLLLGLRGMNNSTELRASPMERLHHRYVEIMDRLIVIKETKLEPLKKRVKLGIVQSTERFYTACASLYRAVVNLLHELWTSTFAYTISLLVQVVGTEIVYWVAILVESLVVFLGYLLETVSLPIWFVANGAIDLLLLKF